MSENLQSEVFRKILDDLEKVCDLNKKIKESVEALNVENDEEIDRTYEALHSSLESSQKALSEIVGYFKKQHSEWLQHRSEKNTTESAVPNGNSQDIKTERAETPTIKAEEIDIEEEPLAEKEDTEETKAEEPAPKVGMLKLVSIEKLLDPSRLSETKTTKTDTDPVIVLSDAELENNTNSQLQNNVHLRKMLLSPPVGKQLKAVNTASVRSNSAVKKRPMRSRSQISISNLADSDSDSEEERTNKNQRRSKKSRRKMSGSSSSDPDFEVAAKMSKKSGSTSRRVKRKCDESSSEDESGRKPADLDEKLRWEAFVSLPCIRCEQLEEYYLKSPQVFLPKITKHSVAKRIRDGALMSDSDSKRSKFSLDSTNKDGKCNNPLTENITLRSLLNTNTNNKAVYPEGRQLNLNDLLTNKIKELVQTIQPGMTEKKQTDQTINQSSNEIFTVSTDSGVINSEQKTKENDVPSLICDKEKKSDEGTVDFKTNSANFQTKEKDDKILPVSDEESDLNQSFADFCEKKDEEAKKNRLDRSKSDEEKGTDLNKNSGSSSMKSSDGKKATSDAESEKKNKNEKTSTKIAKKKVRFVSDEEKQKSSSESEDDFAKFSARVDKDKKSKLKKKMVFSSDSENESDKAKPERNESLTLSSDSEEEINQKKKKTRSRIKRVKDSSSDEDKDSSREPTPEKTTRKQIRKVLTKSSLSESTKLAEKEENERKARILEKQKKYNQIFDAESLQKSTVDKIVLDFDDETKKELLTVHKDLVKHLKPHQATGVKFMWDACFESLERAKKVGSGCILAHCMGLGKTLQVITLSHTLLTNSEKTGVEKILVVCPLNTVLNWVAEFKQWLPKSSSFEVFDIVSYKQNAGRQFIVNEWFQEGGVLIIGYDMFRNLTNESSKRMPKKMRTDFQKALIDPGPDVVICDEGHLLKNEKTSLSIAMNRLKTLRRIVLTGTPLQNNLKEYYCMVQFVKPNLLGTYKEYLNRFVNPITNGQYTDSTPMDIHIMRKRSHVLHKMLDGIVQRKDYCVLAPYLPPKYEYVLFLTLTSKQIELYRYYLANIARSQNENTSKGKTSFLFTDFQELQRICTHPKVLQDKSTQDREKKQNEFSDEESEGSLKDFIDDDDEEEAKSTSGDSDSDSKSDSDTSIKSDDKKSRKTRVTRATAAAAGGIDEIAEENENKPVEWWEQFLSSDDLEDVTLSGKLFLLFEILRQCEAIGDKILVFSQSLYSLNVIEYFLQRIDDATQNGIACGGFSGSWTLGLDYFRIDGSSSCDNRAASCRSFNDPDNIRARLFLISTRAGGLGINLVAANRVIIFDVSWNPSHDVQSIYRVYRFGQTKPCYIYRFVTLGTMEMKIYERQVTKQAISKRVIDEQQIDRHYNQNDLTELYKFEPIPPGERPTPLVPKDVLLGELLQNFSERIYKYHEHQSLLENKEDEVLDEDERKAAWEEFENEKNARSYSSGTWLGLPINEAANAVARMLHNDFPQLDAQLLNVMVPSKMKQIEEEMKASNNETWGRVLSELRQIKAEQQQRFREYYLQQQAMKMMQQQFALAGQAEYLRTLQQLRNQHAGGRAGVHVLNRAQQNTPLQPNEVIDLNE